MTHFGLNIPIPNPTMRWGYRHIVSDLEQVANRSYSRSEKSSVESSIGRQKRNKTVEQGQ